MEFFMRVSSDLLKAVSSFQLTSLPKGALVTGAISAATSYKVSQFATQICSLINRHSNSSGHSLGFKQKSAVIIFIPTSVSLGLSLIAKYILGTTILKAHIVGIVALSIISGYVAYAQNRPSQPTDSSDSSCSSEDDLTGVLTAPAEPTDDGTPKIVTQSDEEARASTPAPAPSSTETRPSLSNVQAIMNKFADVKNLIKAAGDAVDKKKAESKKSTAKYNRLLSAAKTKQSHADPAYQAMHEVIDASGLSKPFKDLSRVLIYPRTMRALVAGFWNNPKALWRLVCLLKHKTVSRNLAQINKNTSIRSDPNSLQIILRSALAPKPQENLFPAGDLTPAELFIYASKHPNKQDILTLLQEKGIAHPTLDMKLSEVVPWHKPLESQDMGLAEQQQMEQSLKLSPGQLDSLFKEMEQERATLAQGFETTSDKTLSELLKWLNQGMSKDNDTITLSLHLGLDSQQRTLKSLQAKNDPQRYANRKYKLSFEHLTTEEHSTLIENFNDGEAGLDNFIQSVAKAGSNNAVRASLHSVLSDTDKRDNYILALEAAATLIESTEGRELIQAKGDPSKFNCADTWALNMYEYIIDTAQQQALQESDA